MAGTVETPYRRAGRGGTVLLLGAAGLFDELAETLRVVEPLRLPAGPVRTGGPEDAVDRVRGLDEGVWRDWLKGLVDGLGLEQPALVVGTGLEAGVRRVAAQDPDRFGPVLAAGTPARVRAALAVHEARGRNGIIDV